MTDAIEDYGQGVKELYHDLKTLALFIDLVNQAPTSSGEKPWSCRPATAPGMATRSFI